MSIESYVSGGGSWGGDVAAVVDQSATIEAQAADVLPAFETVPGLQTIALGEAAFGFGWEIGSTVNTKWLHIEGVGLGNTVGPDAYCIGGYGGQWLYSPIGLAGLGYTTSMGSTPGWVFRFTGFCAGEQTQYEMNSTSTMQTHPAWVQEYNYVNTVVGGQWIDDSGGWHWRFMTVAQMETALRIDQPLQAYTTQHVDGTTGWKVSGGCGDTSTACTYPGSQPNPVTSAPHLRCQLSGDSSDCGSDSPRACIPVDGTGLFGGAGSTHCGLGPGAQHQLDCQTDPVDFACPTPTASGSGFGSSGGYDGSEGPATAAGDDPCKFDEEVGGLDAWNSLNSQGAYNQDCADAWTAMRTAGYIDANGKPTPQILANPSRLIRGDRLGNPSLPDAFAAADPASALTDWYKVATPQLATSEGVPFEVHFYENVTDGVVYLERDYYLVFKKLF